MSGAPVFVALTQAGCDLARRLAAEVPGADVHALAGRVAGADAAFDDVGAHLRALFAAGRPIVGLCAAGVLIRALAPRLTDKAAEPPVLALAEDGSSVVPLLGGHRGANALARRLAGRLGVAPALTTAGDLRFGVALDDPPPGWRLANPQDHKAFAAALLAGARVRLEGPAPWLAESALPFGEPAELTLRATEQTEQGAPNCLVYHPAVLCLGLGCERGAAPEEVADLARRTLRAHGLAEAALAAVVSLDLKADEPALHAAAAAFGVPARFFDAARLEAETRRLVNPSEAVFREVGCHGVAEAAALAAAGAGGVLLVPKAKSARATCAVARAPAPLDPGALGRARGSLAIVGLGPGDPAWRAPEAESALRAASDVVGYRGYLDLLGPPAPGQARHAYDLGEEEARARAALDLAAAGRDVALVSSGDPGIYALAALVFELIERGDRPAWRRPALAVVPGISALQAAAARAGAPLGHDFCAVSLSDLLTPWPTIERRLRAAAEGDFVVALYNPASRRRTRQLARAKEILGAHRPADTPVVLARNLGRPGEAVRVIALSELSAAQVDMLSLVLVGSTTTRRLARGEGGSWVYTPRGYAAKTGQGRTGQDGPGRDGPGQGGQDRQDLGGPSFARRSGLREGGRGVTVHFIGAGPGAADLITVRGRALIARCPVVLYAGSLVPREVVAGAPPGARVIDTAALTLDEIMAEIEAAHARGQDVARVHSGDPSLYGATAEQIRRLEALGIAYTITPGVPAYAAAAAALGCELTLPGVSQTVILTRTAMKASPMPAGEDLGALAASGATLAIHLSVRNLARVVEALAPHYGPDCPVAVVYRASWPDQRIVRGTLGDIRPRVRAAKVTRTALVLVGRVLNASDFADSKLYDPAHAHVLRPRRRG